MNESGHNKYIETKSVKVSSDLKVKTAISRFVSNISCKQVAIIRQL